MQASEVAARYTQPGKQAARKFVVDLAVASGCKTALDFWGGGTSARDFTRAGLSVVSAEMDRSLWSELDRDAAAYGYVAHHGRASQVEGVFDMVWADFTGMVSEAMEDELAELASRVVKYLAVTIMPARELVDEADKFFIRWRPVTVAGFLTAVCGMRLVYLGRYRRSGGQEMWLAILTQASEPYRAIYPSALLRNMKDGRRAYWASDALTKTYRSLFPFATNQSSRTRTPASRKCVVCRTLFTPKKDHPRYRFCSRGCFYENRRPRPPRACATCRETFKPLRRDVLYCSVKCRRRAWEVRQHKSPETRPCVVCSKPFTTKLDYRLYCSGACGTRAYERRRGGRWKPAPLPIAA